MVLHIPLIVEYYVGHIHGAVVEAEVAVGVVAEVDLQEETGAQCFKGYQFTEDICCAMQEPKKIQGA